MLEEKINANCRLPVRIVRFKFAMFFQSWHSLNIFSRVISPFSTNLLGIVLVEYWTSVFFVRHLLRSLRPFWESGSGNQAYVLGVF